MSTNHTTLEAPKVHLAPRRKLIVTVMIIIFSLLALACWAYWLGWGRYAESTEDAFVAGNIVQLMPQVAGTVNGIYTDDTQFVVAGQLLVKLNAADTQVALQKAVATLAQTVRQVKQYYENAAQARAGLTLKQAELNKAQEDFKRRLSLSKANAISREELQHAKIAMKSAKAQYDLAEHQLAATLALVQHSHLYQHPLVEQAATAVRSAYLNLQRTAIQSPISGYVSKRAVQLGQQVTPNTPLLTIIPLEQIWIDANYKESQLEKIRIGQPVTLIVDAYKSVGPYHGQVMGFNPGTGSTFALLPPQNATGNWIKIVQRLPIRIRLNPEEIKRHPLQLGLSVQATVHTDKAPATVPASSITSIYTTSIFDNQFNAAEKLIHSVIEQNAPDIAFEDNLPAGEKQ